MITHVIWDMGETLNTVPNTRYDHHPLDTYPEVVLRKNAKETLEKVKQLGFKQAILSNTATSDTEVIKRVLTNLVSSIILTSFTPPIPNYNQGKWKSQTKLFLISH